MRTFRRIVVSLLALWLIFLAAIYITMRQPPERFATAIAKLPGPAFLLFPFETLWLRARSGTLHIGDQAPDFHLRTLDKTAEVSLSSFRGSKPVVLIFGSYT
jgi:AhpC/TSA family